MTAKELAWVCAIAPEECRKKLTRLCLDANKSIKLPENVFKLPLHISLKKSFYTVDFDRVSEDMRLLIERSGRLYCQIGQVELHRNMLWLALENRGALRSLHEELDGLLKTK